MDLSIVVSALGLVAQLSFPLIVAAALGAVAVGFLQNATQISDEAISFIGKFCAVVVALHMYSAILSSQITEFTRVAWSSRFFF